MVVCLIVPTSSDLAVFESFKSELFHWIFRSYLFQLILTLKRSIALFVFVRALDSSVGLLWSRCRKPRALGEHKRTLEAQVSGYVDVALFLVSAGVVMDAWFYRPDTLPKSYRDWIRSAAQVDDRLVQTLRRAREGDFVYGKDSKDISALRSMCEDYRLPPAWSDPKTTIPLPCELVHMDIELKIPTSEPRFVDFLIPVEKRPANVKTPEIGHI
ncbi:MAG: hypothetical protein Q9209_001130 [Squamulea sp. 1 TL-2023]